MLYVYKITNTKTGMAYVGSSKNPRHRMVSHRFHSRKPPKHEQEITKAIREYGEGAFALAILEETCPLVRAKVETEWIVKENTLHPNGYNLEYADKTTRCQASKERFSKSRRGVKTKPHTAEARMKISLAHKGKKRGPMSDEQKRKISETFKTKGHPFTGRKHSAESIAKMSAAKRGTVVSEATRKKLSEMRKGEGNNQWGKPGTMLGKKFSEEHKKKIGDAIRAAWARKKTQP